MDLTVCGVYIQFLIGDTLILALCSQVEPYFLWDQCCQLGVQRGALFLCVCWGSGWLLLPSGWPRTDISRPVSRGQCLQWRLLLHQHLLGLVRQRVWVAGWLLKSWKLSCMILLASNTKDVTVMSKLDWSSRIMCPPSSHCLSNCCPPSCQEVTLPAAAMSFLTSSRACQIPPVCFPRGSPSPTLTATWMSCHGVPWPMMNK